MFNVDKIKYKTDTTVSMWQETKRYKRIPKTKFSEKLKCFDILAHKQQLLRSELTKIIKNLLFVNLKDLEFGVKPDTIRRSIISSENKIKL